MERLGLDHTKAYTQHQLNEATAAYHASLQVVPVAEPVGGSFPEPAPTVTDPVAEVSSPDAALDQPLTGSEQQPVVEAPITGSVSWDAPGKEAPEHLDATAAPSAGAAPDAGGEPSVADEVTVVASSKKNKKNASKKV